jgi:hypothetical protein
VTNFRVVLLFFENWPKFFSLAFKEIKFKFCEIYGYKKGMTKIFFSHPSLLLLFLDQGWVKKTGSGINIPDPQHCQKHTDPEHW